MVHADLNIPWPTAHLAELLSSSTSGSGGRKGKDASAGRDGKGKGKAAAEGGGGASAAGKKGEVDIWKGMSEEDRKGLRSRVECAIRLGYSIVAFNLVIPQSLDPSSLAPYFPFALTSPPFPDIDPRTCSADVALSGKTALQLSRLTVVMDGKVAGGGKGIFGFSAGQTKYLEKYNILAAQPLDAASFGHACLSLSAPLPHGIDMISLDLSSSPRLPFYLPLHTVSKAVDERVAFEITYAPMTSSSPLHRTTPSASSFPCIDPTFDAYSTSSAATGNAGRRNVIAGAKEVIRATKAKGVIVTSAAGSWNELRAPDDVANLAHLFGLSSDKARKTMSENAQTVIRRGEMTRQTYRGIISNPMLITRSKASVAPSIIANGGSVQEGHVGLTAGTGAPAPTLGKRSQPEGDAGEDEDKAAWARIGSPVSKSGALAKSEEKDKARKKKRKK